MTLSDALSIYLNLNLLILIAFLGLKLMPRQVAKNELRLHYLMASVVIGLTLIQPLLPHAFHFTPPAKVWSATNAKAFSATGEVDSGGVLSVSTPLGLSNFPADDIAQIWMWLAALSLSLGFAFIGRDLLQLLVMTRSSYSIRRIGRVRVMASEAVQVPFSFWWPGFVGVIVPLRLIDRGDDLRMVIAHELQHHRSGDTKWVYLLWGLKTVCPLNPAIHFWNRWITEIQEFACDETLVDQEKVESQAYARCLLEVAQTALSRNRQPVCATGLMFQKERKLLLRRIEKMIKEEKRQSPLGWLVIAAGTLSLIMGATAFASKGLVQDRRVTLAQAKVLVERVQLNGATSGVPLVVNELVLHELNRFIGTPEGREHMRTALARMAKYKAVISQALIRFDAPEELLAVPLVESGYRNLPQGSGGSSVSAGLWQFIQSTARVFGLTVEGHVDERLDVVKATDAALRYLQMNRFRFNDWHLSLLAYNMGEENVDNALKASGARDAWTLIRQGKEGDRGYLARVMAAMIIMKNPESVE